MNSTTAAIGRLKHLHSHLTKLRLCTLADGAHELLCEEINGKGILTINRPHALNSINENVTLRMYKQLKVWQQEKSVSLVIIKGAGGKAFSAGGDIKGLVSLVEDDSRTGGSSAFQFLKDEFRTQYTINTYNVPVISLADGYCMGGGCGTAVNSKYTITTERTTMAMPETPIGFIPDNGGSYFLSHLPGNMGLYLGLTGDQIRGEDIYNIGLSTHHVTHKDGALDRLESDLISLSQPTDDTVSEILDLYHSKCYSGATSSLCSNIPTINRIFSKGRVEDIVRELRLEESDWAKHSLKLLLSNSPLALKLTHRLFRLTRRLNLYDSLSLELTVGGNMLALPTTDFCKGVRALFVEKTGKPQWSPSNIKDVTEEEVSRYFTQSNHLNYEFLNQ
ncbi:hypothetical protein EB796_004467 [Bugula neritina]|uniref:3-hydroxyisobutyryl-CoA hydrolase, mitochondrial n=1 Tax=Bugula neritina TaxID=10212 RepID=A0A7J7KF04_BUGNE|nr:hypothetical protein EB796_004467 [Bugula neritina]